MSPFSVTVQRVPDRELGPLLSQLSRAGFDKPTITYVAGDVEFFGLAEARPEGERAGVATHHVFAGGVFTVTGDVAGGVELCDPAVGNEMRGEAVGFEIHLFAGLGGDYTRAILAGGRGD